VVIGEVGLLGELRPVSGIDRRLREAARLGFERAVIPAVRSAAAAGIPGMQLVPVANLGEALTATMGPAGSSAPRRTGEVTAITIEPGSRVLG
jgi:DNA repair protein RadA/Sms